MEKKRKTMPIEGTDTPLLAETAELSEIDFQESLQPETQKSVNEAEVLEPDGEPHEKEEHDQNDGEAEPQPEDGVTPFPLNPPAPEPDGPPPRPDQIANLVWVCDKKLRICRSWAWKICEFNRRFSLEQARGFCNETFSLDGALGYERSRDQQEPTPIKSEPTGKSKKFQQKSFLATTGMRFLSPGQFCLTLKNESLCYSVRMNRHELDQHIDECIRAREDDNNQPKADTVP